MSAYDKKPHRFLEKLHESIHEIPVSSVFCAGFESQEWRCKQFASHLLEWLQEYALPESELDTNHTNSYEKLRQAALRVYTSPKYEKRGEAGEIALHAICREFFNTIPISPRVFYKSASNDVIKAFDMVHAHFAEDGSVEIWLGESKLYQDGAAAIASAITSIRSHIDAGFLSGQKALLGPQIPKTTPRYAEIFQIFKSQTSLDVFLEKATFVIGILCDSQSAAMAKSQTPAYRTEVAAEIEELKKTLLTANLHASVKLLLLYVPLGSKSHFVNEFDRRLKGIQ